MAYCALLDSNANVIQILAVDNSVENPEEWCTNRFGGIWKQTSFNARIRSKFAGIGDRYDSERDAFISLQPYPSWTLGEDNNWHPPKEYPVKKSPDEFYAWDEELGDWKLAR